MSDKIILGLVLLLAALIVLLFALMFSYYVLLKRIARHFPAYYKRLGSPFLPVANRSITRTIKRDKANYHFLVQIVIGLPAQFPKDKQLKRLAGVIRFEIILSFALLVAGTGLGIMGIITGS